MTHKSFLWSACCLLLLSGNAGFAAQSISIEKPRDMVTLQPGIIGFNSPMGALGEPKGSYISDKMNQALSLLPIQALRFPGGTVANYFDWETGSLIEQALQESGKYKLVDNQRRRKNNDGVLPPVDFASFDAVTGQHGIRRFLVLNLLTSPLESTIATIDRIKKEHPGHYNWELGNELSQGAYSKRAFATDVFNETVYAQLAGSIAGHIAEHYPEDQVGFVIGQLIEGRVPKVKSLGKLQRQRAAWDQAAAGIDHTDAVIVHPYVVGEQRLLRRLKEAADTPNDLPGLTRKSRTRWRWIFACAQELPGRYASLIESRFAGNKIWITEAGLTDSDGSRKSQARQQDMSRVLFNVAYFISWLKEYPAWESFLYHGLFSGQGHMAVFGRNMEWNANTVAYVLLRHLLLNGESIGNLSITDPPGYSGIGLYADSTVRALSGAYVEKEEGGAILLVNTGPEAVQVLAPFEEMRTVTVAGTYDTIVDVSDFEDAEFFHRRSGIHGAVSVPAYSVVLISESGQDILN